MKITFRQHKFKARGSYKCQACGRKYSRTHTRFWSENPFHEWQDKILELNQKCKSDVLAGLEAEKCHQCEAKNSPKVVEWT